MSANVETGAAGAVSLSWSSADGLTLVGDRHAGPGRLVVLLHAGFQNRSAWRAAVGELVGAGCEVIAYDLRGHGESGRSPSAAYAVADHARDAIALLDLVDRPAVLVGASLGGGTALAVAGHPDPRVRARVAALVLVDVTPRLESGGRGRVRTFVGAHLDGFSSLDDAAAQVATYAGGEPRPGRGLTRHLRHGLDGRWYWHWDPRIVTEGFDTYDDALVEEQLEAARRLTAPTLLLRGGASDVTSPSGADEFRAAAPHAEYREIAGAGHMVTAVPNDPYVAASTDFIRSLDVP